jgi:DNA polymerase I
VILLIDADVTCYQAATGAELEIEWEPDIWTIIGDLQKGKATFEYLINKYKEDTQIEEIKLCFSSRQNFRKDVLPTYKSNRKGRKPCGYTALKDWAKETYPFIEKDGLEADDCLGILATKFAGKGVILSIDKDLLTIPGKMYKMKPNGTGEWLDTSQAEADKRFLMQAMAGDSTDGYGGVPGIGLKTAEKLLQKHGFVWKTVLDQYIKAGMTEEDALANARCARILRAEDYDFDKGVVKLWQP